MFGSLLAQFRASQALAAKVVIESWQAEHANGLPASDVADIVDSCLETPALLKRTWNLAYDRIAAGHFEDIVEVRESFQKLFEAELSYLEVVRGLARTLEAAGHAVPGSERLEETITETRRLRDYIFAYWPEWTEQDADEALTRSEQGESDDLEEAFANIAGVDKATWLKRVEEYKRQRDAKP